MRAHLLFVIVFALFDKNILRLYQLASNETPTMCSYCCYANIKIGVFE